MWNQLLGDRLTDEMDSDLSLTRVKDADFVMLYFSASYCPSCHEFSPKLKAAYKTLKKQGKKVEIIWPWLNKDPNDEKEYRDYRKGMPWLCTPFSNKTQTQELRDRFHVKLIPRLVILDKNRKVVNMDGRASVVEDPACKNFPWFAQIGDSPNVSAWELESQAMPHVAMCGMGDHLNNLIQDAASQAILKKVHIDPVNKPSGADEKTPLVKSSELHFYDKYPELDKKYTPRLIITVFIAVLSSFAVGLNISILNVPEAAIRANLVPGQPVSRGSWSVIMSIFAVGALVGSYFGGSMADRYGRRVYILANNAILLAGTACMCLATSVWMMVLGRFVLGIACGTNCVVIPLYLGEISPAHMRGTLGTLNQLFVVLGILCAVIIGKPMATPELWRYLLAAGAAPAMIQCICSPFMVESPRWLVAMCRHHEAEELLCKLRDHCEVRFLESTMQSCVPLGNSLFLSICLVLSVCLVCLCRDWRQRLNTHAHM
jgi:thiol-disulfide isomerase/thioredoxin